MSLSQLANLIPSQRNKLFSELEEIYHSLTKEFEAIPQPCTACGKCCDFKQAEHRLYISSLEYLWLSDKYGKIRPESDTCPFMVNSKCTVRDRRMLGCRTYFRLHTKKDAIEAERLYEKYLRQMKDIYKREGIQWEYRDLMSYF